MSDPARHPAGDDTVPGQGQMDLPVMLDGFGRAVEYLRISVTDKCNLRCVYCMPEEGMPWLRRDQLLTYEEIGDIVRVMVGMGLKRIRLTGGEPLVRKDIVELVEILGGIEGIEDIALTTNAVLLDRLAQPLKAAGVNRINVSLDSLRPERVDAIARRAGSYDKVMEGLNAAERAGFDPIKINTVLMRGTNDDEVADFAALTREHPWHVRFIEIMPTESNLDLSAAQTLGCEEALELVRGMGDLEPVPGPVGNGPARYYRFPGAPGTIGVITPMSHSFCESCNRLRLTADGFLRPCLFGDLQTNLRDPLRAGTDLGPLIQETLRIKPERHDLQQGSSRGSGGLIALSQTGG
jgi:cyclic pyranopterin phosphate synthase